MNFPELREALAAAGKDPLEVTCSDYDDADVIDARGTSDGWVLWHHDDVWEVGGVERGRFLPDSRFATEEQACARLAQILLTDRPVRTPTPQDDRRSEEAARTNADQFARLLAEQREKE